MENPDEGLVVPTLLIGPTVRLNDCAAIFELNKLNEVNIIWLVALLTVQIGVVFIDGPDKITVDIVDGKVIYDGKVMVIHPLEDRLSFKVTLNKNKVLLETVLFWTFTTAVIVDGLAISVAEPIIFWKPFRVTATIIGSVYFIDGGAVNV